MSKIVKMTRDDGKTADVHPEMIDDYKAGGYVEAKTPAKKSAPKPKGK